MNGTPPMPTSEAEWAAHWAFYRLTVAQRDGAWRELERLRGPQVQCEAYVQHGPGHQSRTKCEVKKPGHQYHFAHDPMCPGWEWETNVASIDYGGDLREIPDE